MIPIGFFLTELVLIGRSRTQPVLPMLMLCSGSLEILEHVITLTATDSDGNAPGTSAQGRYENLKRETGFEPATHPSLVSPDATGARPR